MMLKHVHKELLYPELSTLDIGGQQMFPNRALIRAASKADTPSTSGRRTPPSRLTKHLTVPQLNVCPATPGPGNDGPADSPNGGVSPVDKGTETSKAVQTGTSPGDSVFDSPDPDPEPRFSRQGYNRMTYDLVPGYDFMKRQRFSMPHPLYTPLVVTTRSADTGWRCGCCWKPILIVVVSLVILALLAVLAVYVLGFVDEINITSVTPSGESRILVRNMMILKGHLTFIPDSVESNYAVDNNLPSSERKNTISDWLEASLQDILDRSYLRDVYLYAQTIGISENLYYDRATFKLYFYNSTLLMNSKLETSASSANLLRILREGFSEESSKLVGYQVDLKSLTLDFTLKDQ